jgi:hypothetical protein
MNDNKYVIFYQALCVVKIEVFPYTSAQEKSPALRGAAFE